MGSFTVNANGFDQMSNLLISHLVIFEIFFVISNSARLNSDLQKAKNDRCYQEEFVLLLVHFKSFIHKSIFCSGMTLKNIIFEGLEFQYINMNFDFLSFQLTSFNDLVEK